MTDENIKLNARAKEIRDQQLRHIHGHTDRVFAVLFVLQWIFAVGCALVISPRTWVGSASSVHVHVWMAIVVGGLLSSLPIAAALLKPGAWSTRYVIAIAQMLYSALLIHLTGGRIETHFHVFGSLAILAFYRDRGVLAVATAVIIVDHLLRGLFWPASVFGVFLPAPWRALEHAGWIVFEVAFLSWGCRRSIHDLTTAAFSQAELEDAKSAVEERIERRTRQLQDRTAELEAEMHRRQALEGRLTQSEKLEAVGQLAAGIAHEINTPMQFLSDNIEFLSECSEKLLHVVDVYELNLSPDGPHKSWDERRRELDSLNAQYQFDHIREQVPNALRESLEGIERVIHIVRAMQEFAHPGREQKIGVDLNNAVRSTATITRNRWKYAADLELDLDPDLPTLRCVPAEINQVLLNLIVNAADAVVEMSERNGEKGRIIVRTLARDEQMIIEVEDSGHGIPEQLRGRIFDPFFTTKDVGKGTGQGLAICYDIVVNKHQGSIDVKSEVGVGTTFRVTLPLALKEDAENLLVACG